MSGHGVGVEGRNFSMIRPGRKNCKRNAPVVVQSDKGVLIEIPAADATKARSREWVYIAEVCGEARFKVGKMVGGNEREEGGREARRTLRAWARPGCREPLFPEPRTAADVKRLTASSRVNSGRFYASFEYTLTLGVTEGESVMRRTAPPGAEPPTLSPLSTTPCICEFLLTSTETSL